jgi:putrescine transport system permease protein
VNPSVNAMATVIISIVFIGVITASYLIARAERERSRAMAQAQRDGG